MDDTQMPESMVHVLERMLDEGFSLGNPEIVDELCSPDLVEHQFGLAGEGAEAIAKLKQCIVDVHTAMPDVRFTTAGWAVDGDTVWLRADAAGTNTGPFLGPPTGLPVTWTVIDVARIVDGRIVEHWGIPDRFEILVRLGRLTRPEAA